MRTRQRFTDWSSRLLAPILHRLFNLSPISGAIDAAAIVWAKALRGRLKIRFIYALLMVCLGISGIFYAISIKVPDQYANISDTQLQAQNDRHQAAYNATCTAEGGVYQEGMFPCTAAAPDLRALHEIYPIENPLHDETISHLVVVLLSSVVLAIWASFSTMFTFIELLVEQTSWHTMSEKMNRMIKGNRR